MSDLQMIERRLKGRKRRKRLMAILLASLLIWAGLTWFDQQTTLLVKQDELKKIQQVHDQLNLENEELQYEVNRLHDPDYIAEIARKDYHLSKPGEVIFITPE